jgi:beta-lactamase superfamily II metal-dependent hydrolase
MSRRHALACSLVCALALALAPTAALGQAVNGKLQIHFMNVNQGDGALLISPGGETVLFDNGFRGYCDWPVSYMQGIGVTQIDYHIASHYHDDHIGCTTEVLTEFPLKKAAYDRGGTYSSQTFTKYKQIIGTKRVTATAGTTITLDQGSANPVTIKIVALEGNGVPGADDENDFSLAAVVRFGAFDAVIAGDLSGVTTGHYTDIETSVAPLVGRVEVYKVNHHGSRYSSNEAWLEAIKPRIGVISAGFDRDHGHPTAECLDRLHAHNVRTYWTGEGTGAAPVPGLDVVGDNILVEVQPGATTFTVTYNWVETDTYALWPGGAVGGGGGGAAATSMFAWSKKSNVYHIATCMYVENISPANLQTGPAPPAGKRLHTGCPK